MEVVDLAELVARSLARPRRERHPGSARARSRPNRERTHGHRRLHQAGARPGRGRARDRPRRGRGSTIADLDLRDQRVGQLRRRGGGAAQGEARRQGHRVTVGDEDAEEVLRRALAMGADEALHLLRRGLRGLGSARPSPTVLHEALAGPAASTWSSAARSRPTGPAATSAACSPALLDVPAGRAGHRDSRSRDGRPSVRHEVEGGLERDGRARPAGAGHGADRHQRAALRLDPRHPQGGRRRDPGEDAPPTSDSTRAVGRRPRDDRGAVPAARGEGAEILEGGTDDVVESWSSGCASREGCSDGTHPGHHRARQGAPRRLGLGAAHGGARRWPRAARWPPRSGARASGRWRPSWPAASTRCTSSTTRGWPCPTARRRAALRALIERERFEAVLAPHTNGLIDLLPALAARLGAAAARGLPAHSSGATGGWPACARSTAGKVQARVCAAASERGVLATVRGGAFRGRDPRRAGERRGARREPCRRTSRRGVVRCARSSREAGAVDISQSQELVGVGRGIEDEENLELVAVAGRGPRRRAVRARGRWWTRAGCPGAARWAPRASASSPGSTWRSGSAARSSTWAASRARRFGLSDNSFCGHCLFTPDQAPYIPRIIIMNIGQIRLFPVRHIE